jgi:hypothetical protein
MNLRADFGCFLSPRPSSVISFLNAKKSPALSEGEGGLNSHSHAKGRTGVGAAFQGDKGPWLPGGSNYLLLNFLLNPASPKSPEPSKTIFGF